MSALITILLIVTAICFGVAAKSVSQHGFDIILQSPKAGLSAIASVVLLVMTIGLANSIGDSYYTNNSSNKTSATATKPSTYLKSSHNSDGFADQNYDGNGKTTFDIYVHKGTTPYFGSTYSSSNTHHKDDDGNTLTKVSPTHYQLNMKYDANDDTDDANHTQINAKSKSHKKADIFFTAHDNSNEKNQMNIKNQQNEQQLQQDEAQDKANKQAKLQKDYPPLSSKVNISDIKSKSADDLLDLGNFQLTGKVVTHADDGDDYDVIMQVNGTDQLFMATIPEDQGDKYVGDGKDITIYGTDLDPKRQVTMNMVNNGVDSGYYTDSLIAVTNVDKVFD